MLATTTSRVSRRYYWRLDRWRPALDRFREAARVGGVVISPEHCGSPETHKQNLKVFYKAIQISELFGRRLAGSRRFDLAAECCLDSIRACRDLRNDANWLQWRLALQLEKHQLRELRDILGRKHATAQQVERFAEELANWYFLGLDIGPLLQQTAQKYANARIKNETGPADRIAQIRHAIYNQISRSFLRVESNGDDFHTAEIENTLVNPFDQENQFVFDEIAAQQLGNLQDVPGLVESQLNRELIEIREITALSQSRNTAVAATYTWLKMLAHQKRVGFYPSRLENAFGADVRSIPRDGFSPNQPIQLRPGTGDKLRGNAIDGFRKSIRTRINQPIIYSVGIDSSDDDGAMVWDGTINGRGDWLFPLPETRRKRHWLQFDLRKLSILAVAIGLLISQLISPQAQERRAINALSSPGFEVTYGPGTAKNPTVVDWLFGPGKGHATSVEINLWLPHYTRLISHLTHLDELKLNCSEELKNDELRFLESLPNLTSLDLSVGGINDEALRFLSGLNKLQYLDLGESEVLNKHLKHLPYLPSLETFYLNGCELDGAKLEFFKNVPNVETLTLYNSSITDQDLPAIGKLTRLTTLDLDGTKITGNNLSALSNLSNLTTLDIQNLPIKDDHLKHLTALNKLQELRMNNSSLQGNGLKHLLGMKDLSSLELNNTTIDDRSISSLGKLNSLRSLDIKNTRITYRGANRLRQIHPGATIAHSPSGSAAIIGSLIDLIFGWE